MDNPRSYRCVERHFLNLPGFNSGAYIRAEVKDSSEKETRRRYSEVVLEIADCDRHINLEFNLSDAAERMNSFHKIDTLLSTLTKMREAMSEEAVCIRQLKKNEKLVSTSTSEAS
jgi:hypothetical protein